MYTFTGYLTHLQCQHMDLQVFRQVQPFGSPVRMMGGPVTSSRPPSAMDGPITSSRPPSAMDFKFDEEVNFKTLADNCKQLKCEVKNKIVPLCCRCNYYHQYVQRKGIPAC